MVFAIHCSDEQNNLNLENVDSENLTAKYSGQIRENKLILSLELLDIDKKTILKRGDRIDISDGFRLNVHTQLKEIAKNILETTSSKDILPITNAIQNAINKFAESHELEDMGKEEVQGMFYYLAVFKMISRYNEEKLSNPLSTLHCASYNGYIVGLTPYYTKEDLKINKNDLIKYLSGNPTRLTRSDANDIIILLKESNTTEITFLSLEESIGLRSIEKSKTLKSAWLEGGDCGCCGNYQGVCYFWQGVCWVHDYMCQQCSPDWYCLKGCKPTPC